jgi:hypothetical protein
MQSVKSKRIGFLITIIGEFLSRGLIWFRLLGASFLMNDADFGFLVLLVSAEALFGLIVSYPQQKEMLRSGGFNASHAKRAFQFFLILIPFIYVCVQLYFGDVLISFVIILSCAFFSANNLGHYAIRINNLHLYNKAKVISAVVSSCFFVVVINTNALYLPIVYFSSLVVIIFYFLKIKILNSSEDVNLKEKILNWSIFGTQAGLTAFAQYGNRFFIGLILPLAAVASYTKAYMFASAVTFYYAGVMSYYEKSLFLSSDIAALPIKLFTGLKCLMLLMFGWLLYNLTLFMVPYMVNLNLDYGSRLLFQRSVYYSFALYFCLQALYFVINPILISYGYRFLSLLATLTSVLVQIILYLLFLDDLDVVSIAKIVLLGQACLVFVLIFGVVNLLYKLKISKRVSK